MDMRGSETTVMAATRGRIGDVGNVMVWEVVLTSSKLSEHYQS